MASLNFPAYGSLYFSDAPIESNLKIPLDHEFCIGPNCNSVLWNRNPGEPELYGGPSPNCGPWESLTSYCQGLIATGFSRLPKKSMTHSLPHQGSVEEHVRLIKASEQVMRMLVEDTRVQGAAAPTLLHPDFQMRNIFVSADDPTIITGLIDWQSTGVEPALIYANETPDFAAPPEEPEEEMPESGQSEQKSPEMRERERKDALICYQTYDVYMKGLIPKTELGLQGACPFSPTEEELKEHAQNYEDFETVQRLRSWLKSALYTDSDGWASNTQWDAAKDAHRAVYDQWIETARELESDGEGLTVEKADKLWPFDAR
ncbi:hypothetical protein MY5147_002867 [Beauveria neobassiana]